MPHPTVDAKFKATLTSGWTAPKPPLVGGAVAVPNDGTSFLVLQFPIVNGDKPALGRHFCENGAARLILNVERAIVETDGYSWAATLASLFRNRDLGSGVETFTPDGPIVNDMSDEGNYVELNVIVPYRYQFTDA